MASPFTDGLPREVALTVQKPMISMDSKKTPSFSADQPSKIEAAYSMLNQELSVLTQELALIS